MRDIRLLALTDMTKCTHVIGLAPAALHAHRDLAHFLAVEIAKELYAGDAGICAFFFAGTAALPRATPPATATG